MNRFLKLVNFELTRFMKLYWVLIGLTIVLQFTGVIVKSLSFVQLANREIYQNSLTKAEFITQNGYLSFAAISKSVWFLAPIAISATVMLGYIFFIWYREWFAKNTFIYRLLMLPTSRLSIYFSKAAAIIICVLGLITLEMLLVPLELSLFKMLVPGDLRKDLSLTGVMLSFYVLSTIIPRTFTQFILYYGMGITAVFILFTAVLFERCFRWKGLILGVIYSAASVVVFISPIIFISTSRKNPLYPAEFLGLEIVLGLIVMAAAISVSGFLLKKKITV